MKWRDWVANSFLLFASIILTFALLGYVIIYSGLIMRTPLKFQFALPPAIAVLAQNSKAGLLPKDYILIVGDSYAKGNGDWLLGADPNTNPEYSTAHVLHHLTGRDVITYGKPGASSIKGWVREPSALDRFMRAAIDENYEQPKIILAYFYVGNDLTDNLLQVQGEFIPAYGEAALSDEAVWNAYLDKMIHKNKAGPYRKLDTTFGWLIGSTAEIVKEGIKTNKANKQAAIMTAETGLIENRVVINGVDVLYQNDFEGPGLGLTPQDTDVAFLALSRSLRHLKYSFPNSKIVVVYIPSPAESYTLSSEQIRIVRRIDLNGDMVRAHFHRNELFSRSDEIATRLANEATYQNIGFIDTRRDMMSAGRKEIIHGEHDAVHYNEAGYRALSLSIACHMSKSKLWTEHICSEKEGRIQ